MSRTDTHFPEACERLAAWVRHRPDLVGRDAWARELLAGPGASDRSRTGA